MKLITLFEEANHIIYNNEYGYIKGKKLPDGYWWIDKFYIYPEFRGKGVARELAKHIPEKSKLLAQPLIVKGQTHLPRQPLIDFYKSLGFQERPDSNDNMMMVRESLDILFEHLKKVGDKWALVSKTTGRVLRYYHGEGKPSEEWVSKMEQQIHSFESVLVEYAIPDNVYQEEDDSAFTHDGKLYKLNPFLAKASMLNAKSIPLDDLKWILRYSKPESDERVEKADTNFPILVTPWKDKLVVIDGLHRMAKALSTKQKDIKAKIIPTDWFDDYK